MDYAKLIERLSRCSEPLVAYKLNADFAAAIVEAIAVLKDLPIENQTLRADLARVTAKRDAAVDEVIHLKAVMRDEGIVVIPPKYPWERPEWNR